MHNSLMNVLQQIFTDYYEEIEYTLHPSLKDILVVRSMAYLLPQVGQKRLWQRKGTNFQFLQCVQIYMAPP